MMWTNTIRQNKGFHTSDSCKIRVDWNSEARKKFDR